MYICKHCNEEISSLDDVSVHNCFVGKAVFMEENVLFYSEKDERKYSNKLLSILLHIYCFLHN